MAKPIKISPLKKPPARPGISLCVIFRDNEDTIGKLLDSVEGHFDEFCFTDTGCTDLTRGIIETFAVKVHPVPVKITDFAWCDDFAKARQANFEAATGRWRMFLDTDDELIRGETIRDTVAICDKNPKIQGWFVGYDYDRLEELETMRCVKWSKAWSWQDAIHERLVSSEDMDAHGFARVTKDRFAVRHKRKTAEDKERALRRNAAIAEREYLTTTDPEYKARLARTMAMTAKLDGDFERAIPLLKEVGDGYPHLPEGKQAYADLSRLYASNLKGQQLDVAEGFAKKAGPTYEAIVAYQKQDFAKVIHKHTCATGIMGPQTTHEGFLFEKALGPAIAAESALRLKYPAAAVERCLNTIRSDLRKHDMMFEHVSLCRTEIDRVTILVPGTPQPFDDDSTGNMLGGSEEAVVYLSRALAAQGRNVRVYGMLPPTSVPGMSKSGVEYRPFSEFNLRDEHGTLVIWRSVQLLDQLLGERARVFERMQAGDETAIEPTGIGRSSLWLHDMSIGVRDPEVANAILSAVDSVIVLSEHHQKCIERELPAKHTVRFVRLSNGIQPEDVFYEHAEVVRDPNRVMYSSCPSRGLEVLLTAWPKVKAACPEAKLDIYYDWSGVKNHQPDLYSRLMDQMATVADLDVVHHGGVGHAELREAFFRTNVWAYSHFRSTDVETFAISSVKAMAGGATVLTGMHGALTEVVPEAQFTTEKYYAEALIDLLKRPISDEKRREKAKGVAERFRWPEVAKRFSAEWTVKREPKT